MKRLVAAIAGVAQAGVIAWGADFVFESHSQAAALFGVPGVITWMLALLVLGMGWYPLLGAAVVAELVAIAGRRLGDREAAPPGYPFCLLAFGLLAFAGWQVGLACWPPPPAGRDDSRGLLFHALLAMTALVYVTGVAFAVRMTLRPRAAVVRS